MAATSVPSAAESRLAHDACPPPLAVYRLRRPRETPLYRLIEDHFETLVRVHEQEFEQSCGRLRRAARRAVEKFQDCGLLERGFACVRCDWCRAEFRVAYRALRDFTRATCRAPGVVPGVVACIQTHGSLVSFHPHLHLLLTDGAFRSDGTFLHLGYHEIEVLTEAFRRGVLREFVRLDLLTEDDARSMLQWPHSGFHAHHSVRLEADDACGLLQFARYSARAPISLERLQYEPRKQQVTLQSDKRDGPTAGTHVFPALEFLARLLVHVPDTRERLVREYGAYSVRRRARWRTARILADTRTLAAISPAALAATPDWPAPRAMRQRWAELLKRIFEVDPLRCRRCGGEMRALP